jgi:hypothetical protein
MKKKQKKQLNEFALTTILGSILILAWVTGLFNRIADRIDAYTHGRDVETNNAIKAITKKLSKSKSFIKSIDDLVQKYGINSNMINALLNTSEVKSALNQYKNNKDINFENLKTEFTKVISNAIYEEAEDRGLVDSIERKVKNTNWA